MAADLHLSIARHRQTSVCCHRLLPVYHCSSICQMATSHANVAVFHWPLAGRHKGARDRKGKQSVLLLVAVSPMTLLCSLPSTRSNSWCARQKRTEGGGQFGSGDGVCKSEFTIKVIKSRSVAEDSFVCLSNVQ